MRNRLLLTLLFARKYLFSRKSHSVINRVSAVSALTVAVPVAAMIVLLSVFNGFDSLVHRMYGNFDPDLEITPTEGKQFVRDSIPVKLIAETEGIETLGEILEEDALFEYQGSQFVGVIRGVSDNYRQVVPVDTMIVRGDYLSGDSLVTNVLVGQGVSYALNINPQLIEPLNVYIPSENLGSVLLPMAGYRNESAFPVGIFALDAQTDSRYVLAPISFTERLIGEKVRSALHLKLKSGYDPQKTAAMIGEKIGPQFQVKTRYEQRASFYRILKAEKWGIYFILLLVLVIGSLSLIGALIMLIIDKRRDIFTLRTLGADNHLIRTVFQCEGMLISGIGIVSGTLLGLVVCWGQHTFGWVKLSGQTFLLESYPVEIQITDIIGVIFTVLLINFLTTAFTVSATLKPHKR